MSKFETLLAEYSENHRNRMNKLLHWANVPLIYLSAMGLLWEVKLPVALPFFNGMPLNLALPLSLLGFIYYLNLSFTLGIGMLIYSTFCLAGCLFWEATGIAPLWMVCLCVFIVSWIGQFIGHKIEGKKPSFFRDVQFFLIGPAWIVANIYHKLGVKL